MLLVEQHIITDNSKQLMRTSLIARKLFNKTRMYIEKHDCNYLKLYNVFKKDDLYKQLKSHVAQQVLRLVEQNYKSYKAAIKEYKRSPNKFTGKPETYKPNNKPLVLIYTNQVSSIKKFKIKLSKTLSFPYYDGVTKFQQIRIKHVKDDTFKLEIIYEKPEELLDNQATNYMGIDIGLQYLCGIGITDGSSYLVSGSKSNKITQRYDFLTNNNTVQTKRDKKYVITKSKRKHGWKKYRRNQDLLHKVSRKIVNLAKDKKVKTIVIAHNKDWTRQTNIGATNNRKMSSFGLVDLIHKITYKAKLLGIKVVEQEESYTSKCDFLANEDIRYHKKYSGVRSNRSCFVSSTGKKIHADINASFNIIKKHIDVSAPHDKICYEEIQNKGCVYHPSYLDTE